jgi:hypothetical protein
MIVIDENFPESQRQLLKSWRIRIRQIGYEIGRKGLKDPEIIPLLLQLRNLTFFTLDSDFFKQHYCYSHYCLVFLDVNQYEAATFIRRFLKHTEFNTQAKRLGKVIRVSHTNISMRQRHSEEEVHITWAD